MIHLLLCAALVLAPPGVATADDALAEQVERLVHRLDARQLTDRDEAERKLLELGFEALPLLPAITDRTPPEAAKRIARVRGRWMREQAKAAARPSLVTLKGRDLPLDDVLHRLAEQTSNPISDHRAAFGQHAEPARVTVDFDKTPFWKALDDVLDQAELTLYGFTGERGAFVINRPPTAGPRSAQASYAGMFRLEPLRFEAYRDLRKEDLSALRFSMEVSWEPRLQPFAIVQPLADVSAVSEAGEAIVPAVQRAEPETLIRPGFSTTELEIPFELPPRNTKSIRTLKGKLLALVPGPFEDFRFDELPIAARNVRPQAVEMRKAETIVVLDAVRTNNDIWEVNVRVRFEAPTTALESHRAWVFDNEAFFEDAAGQRIDTGGLEQTRHTKEEIGIRYFFDLPDGPQELTFVYRTPLVVMELPIEYEFRELRLP